MTQTSYSRWVFVVKQHNLFIHHVSTSGVCRRTTQPSYPSWIDIGRSLFIAERPQLKPYLGVLFLYERPQIVTVPLGDLSSYERPKL